MARDTVEIEVNEASIEILNPFLKHQKNRAMWIDRLENGDYHHTRGNLHTMSGRHEHKFCALGILFYFVTLEGNPGGNYRDSATNATGIARNDIDYIIGANDSSKSFDKALTLLKAKDAALREKGR